jgi:hypothetical protein
VHEAPREAGDYELRYLTDKRMRHCDGETSRYAGDDTWQAHRRQHGA